MTMLSRKILRCAFLAAAILGFHESVLAADSRGIVVFNDCDDSDVRFALRIRDDGVWRTVHWWRFDPNAIRTLYEGAKPLTTDNRTGYFYAEGDNSVWSGRPDDSGDRTYSIDDRKLRFRDIRFAIDDDGSYFLKISCADTTRKLLVNAIKDDNVPPSTEIRIVYEPFRYFYAFLVDKRRYPHVYVVAMNPKDPGDSYYTDAGKAGFKRKKRAESRTCRSVDQLCSEVRNAKLVLGKLRNQQSFVVNLPYNEVVERMKRYSNATNAAHIDYRYYDRNCAGYVFSFIREALNKNIKPNPPIDPGDDMKVLGWREELNVNWRRHNY